MSGTPTPAPPGAPEPAEDEASYGTRVEEAFIAERGTPFLLSPKDWRLVCSWREAGIPADTVIRAVRGAFEKKRARGDASRISSLAYCSNAVEVAWQMERRGLAGAHGPGPAPEAEPFDAAPRLTALAAALRAAAGGVSTADGASPAGKALREAASSVAALEPSSGLEPLEEALGRLERALVKKLEKTLGEPERDALSREVEEEAGDVSALGREAQRRVLSALRSRAVRRRFDLPPLTLLGG